MLYPAIRGHILRLEGRSNLIICEPSRQLSPISTEQNIKTRGVACHLVVPRRIFHVGERDNEICTFALA